MKKKPLINKIFVTALLIVSSMLLNSAIAQNIFVENESLVVVEIESVQNKSGWTEGNTTYNGKQITYYYNHVTDYFSTPGTGILEYKIKINNPGTYCFLWHNKVGEGTKNTEANDSWLKIADADEFFAKKAGSDHIIHPKGVCSSSLGDCPEGAGRNGWFKVYCHGTINWTWRSKTNDKDPYPIYATFNSAGIYTVQISMRSKNHFVDRFVLYNPSKYSESQATNLSLPESSTVSTSVSNTLLDDMVVYPNPATTHLMIHAKNNKIIRYEIVGLSGTILLKGEIVNKVENIDISSLSDGMYILNCYDMDGVGKSTRFAKSY